jgi:hypothetical protein
VIFNNSERNADAKVMVRSWYWTYLHREPDGGSVVWVRELQTGLPANKVLASILGSDQYYANAGSTPQGFVDVLSKDLTDSQVTLDPALANTTDNRVALAYDLLLTYTPWRT